MELSMSNYHFAILRLRVLLSEYSAPGSKADIETMQMARFIEDYEIAKRSKSFEPYYVDYHSV